MWLRALGCAVLGLAVVAMGLEAGAGKDKDVKDKAAKDKVAKDKDDKNAKELPEPRKDPKAVIGVMKGVDLKGEAFTITLDGGKDRTFGVTKDTKFIGPRGGITDERLKDDRLDKGYEVIVIPADAKTAKEVHLPYRKKVEEPKKDKAKDKAKKTDK